MVDATDNTNPTTMYLEDEEAQKAFPPRPGIEAVLKNDPEEIIAQVAELVEMAFDVLPNPRTGCSAATPYNLATLKAQFGAADALRIHRAEGTTLILSIDGVQYELLPGMNSWLPFGSSFWGENPEETPVYIEPKMEHGEAARMYFPLKPLMPFVVSELVKSCQSATRL